MNFNIMGKIPSIIYLSGNSSLESWYWMSQGDLSKFYRLNRQRIKMEERISLDEDRDNQVFFVLSYR